MLLQKIVLSILIVVFSAGFVNAGAMTPSGSRVRMGGDGGTAGTDISSFPATLESWSVDVDGATATGTAYNFPGDRATFHIRAVDDNTTAYTCTITIYFANEYTGFTGAGEGVILDSIELSGTGTTADHGGVWVTGAPFAYLRVDATNMTGAGSTCVVTMNE